MQFSPSFSVGLFHGEKSGPSGRESSCHKIALADRIFYCLGAARELREIERISVKHYHRRIALTGLVPLHDTLLKDEVGAGAVVQQFANLRKNGDAFVGIAPVIQRKCPASCPVRAAVRECGW